MNVLHVVCSYPTEGNPQKGAFIKVQIESLKRIGVNCDVFVLEGNIFIKYLFGIYKLKKYLKTHHYDLIHSHYIYSALVVYFATDCKFIISFMGSDIYGKLKKNGKYKHLSKKLHSALSKTIIKKGSFIIVKSKNNRDALELKENYKILPNGVNLKIFYPNSEITKRELKLLDYKKYILFAGRPERIEKGYELSKEAFSCAFSNNNEIELINIRNKSPLEVSKYLNVCDCILMTSIHEGSPNMIKEALACNLPIVSVNVGDVSERITGVNNCYLTSRNKYEIAEALKKVIESNSRSNNGFSSIQELSDIKIADRLKEIYKKVIAN